MNLKNLYSSFEYKIHRLYKRQTTVTGRQRLTLLLFCYLPIMVIGVIANFLGITEPSASFFGYTHTLCIIAAGTVFLLFYDDHIRVVTCLAAFTIIGQIILSIEMIYCATQATPYYIMLIMANMVLLAMNTMLSMAASMKINTMVLGAAAMTTYIICAYVSNSSLLKSFIIVFIIAFLFVSLVGVWMWKSANTLETENGKFKDDESKLLHILRLKKNDVLTFITLASEKCSQDGTRVLLERLDEKSRYNLLTNVEIYLRDKNTDIDVISRAFPTFSPSEKEICRLIAQGKKVSEICKILGKKEANVNSQRTNMRKKLGLKPEENLQAVLQERLKKANELVPK